MKTQGSLPTEDAALILLFSLVATGQIKLRRIDGHATIAAVISKRLRSAAWPSSRALAVAARDETIASAQSLTERQSRARRYPDILLAAIQDGVGRDRRSMEFRKTASRFSESSGTLS